MFKFKNLQKQTIFDREFRTCGHMNVKVQIFLNRGLFQAGLNPDFKQIVENVPRFFKKHIPFFHKNLSSQLWLFFRH
jgi:hypothetical protein